MTVNILGTDYKIIVSDDSKDVKLKSLSGYCDDTSHKIVVSDIEYDELSKENLTVWQKKVIRHEIVHAFLSESGLANNSDWANNEEMIDWIAMQGLKLYDAWKKANAV